MPRLLAGYGEADFENLLVNNQLIMDFDLEDYIFMTDLSGNLIIKNEDGDTLFTFGKDGTFTPLVGTNTSIIQDADSSTSISTQATAETIIFSTTSTEAMRIDSLGNVGIGTNSPGSLLDVNGLITATTIQGTLTTAAQTNITSVGTLSSLTVSGNIGGTLTTVAQPNITSVGNLSTLTVGTSTANIEVMGSNSSIASSLQLARDSATSYQLTNDNGNYEISQYTDGIGSLVDFYSYTGASHRFSTSGTEKVRIATDGSLGIGTNNPTSTLHIKSATTPQLLIDNDSFAQNDMKFQSNRSSTNIISDISWFNTDTTNAEIARIRIQKSDDADGNGEIQFHTANGTTLTERMTIANDGFVGINHAPVYQLDIGGMTRIIGEVDSTIDGGGVFTQTYMDKCILLNRDANVYRNYYLGLLGDNTTTANKFAIGIDGGAGNNPDPQMSLDAAGRMVLADGLSIGSETATSPLYVVGDGHITVDLFVGGDLGIGTIAPNATLEVADTSLPTIRITNKQTVQSTGILGMIEFHSEDISGDGAHVLGEIYVNGVSTTGGIPNTEMWFSHGSGGTAGLGMVLDNSGDLYNANGVYGTISDMRVKENIVVADSQWEDMKSLDYKKYTYLNNDNVCLGLIAQEVEEISPGLVTTSETPRKYGDIEIEDMKTIKQSVLYMKGMKTLQEAQLRIETLETTVSSLEARLTAAGL